MYDVAFFSANLLLVFLGAQLYVIPGDASKGWEWTPFLKLILSSASLAYHSKAQSGFNRVKAEGQWQWQADPAPLIRSLLTLAVEGPEPPSSSLLLSLNWFTQSKSPTPAGRHGHMSQSSAVVTWVGGGRFGLEYFPGVAVAQVLSSVLSSSLGQLLEWPTQMLRWWHGSAGGGNSSRYAGVSSSSSSSSTRLGGKASAPANVGQQVPSWSSSRGSESRAGPSSQTVSPSPLGSKAVYLLLLLLHNYR